MPPRARRCGGSGGGGAPPVGGLLRRPRGAGALVGLRCGRAPAGRPPSAAPSLLARPPRPGAPPPAPPLRGGCALRACPRSSRRGAPRAAGAASPPSWRLRRAGGFPRRGCGWSVCGGSRGVRLRARDWRLRRWHLKRRPPCPRLERPAKPGHRQLPTSAHSRLCAGPRPAPYRCSKS